VKCFGGWGKGKPDEARGEGGQHGWQGPAGGANTGREGLGGGGQHGPRRGHERKRTGQREARRVHYAPGSH